MQLTHSAKGSAGGGTSGAVVYAIDKITTYICA
jgi:hypothetical protein